MSAGRGYLDAGLALERSIVRGTLDIGWRLSRDWSLLGRGWVDYNRDTDLFGYGAGAFLRGRW